MYQKSDTLPIYVGTTFAAKMLHLSVGTVQKLIDSGSLPAHLTAGGHRRISYDTVIKYGQNNKIPMPKAATNASHDADAISICVLYGEKGITPNIAEIVNNGTFQVVNDPMKLIRAASEISHIFIDARIEWINWEQMAPLSSGGHCVVYNSGMLSISTRQHIEKIASMIDANISLPLLNGYRMGLNFKCNENTNHTSTQTIQQ